MGLRLAAGSAVFVDTAPLIYFFENHERYASVMERFFLQSESAALRLLTSTVTYMEIMTQPLRLEQQNIADKYRSYFTNTENLILIPVSLAVADKAAHLRAIYSLKTPDAIQIAAAIVNGADYVLTNDIRWRRITEINVVCLEDLEALQQAD